MELNWKSMLLATPRSWVQFPEETHKLINRFNHIRTFKRTTEDGVLTKETISITVAIAKPMQYIL